MISTYPMTPLSSKCYCSVSLHLRRWDEVALSDPKQTKKPAQSGKHADWRC